MTRDWLLMLPLLAPPLLLSLTLHEFAHAKVALLFGDPTARNQGRVTLNPLKHLDPIGTFLILFAGFGWARPVPVNPYNLHPRRMGDLCVSAAGIVTNLSLAVLFGGILRLLIWRFGYFQEGLVHLVYKALLFTVTINVVLCVFNFLPLYPLDGHHILRELLPDRLQQPYMQWQMRFGFFALIALVVGPGLLQNVLGRSVPDPLGDLLVYFAGKLVPLLT